MRGVYRAGKTLWFGCERALYSLQSGKLTRYGSEDGLPADDWDAILLTPNGDLWLRSTKLTCWRPHGQTRFRTVAGLAPSFLSGSLGLTGDGSVMIPTTNGLAIVDSRGVQTVNDKRGPPHIPYQCGDDRPARVHLGWTPRRGIGEMVGPKRMGELDQG